MKKINILLLLCLCMIFPLSVYAEDNISSTEEGKNQASTSITIGSVEVPIYEVFIDWAEPTFDWVYDTNTNEFGWKPTTICYEYYGDAEEMINQGEILYTNNSCTTVANNYTEGTEYYAAEERESFHFTIEDASQYGEIVPSVNWTSNSKYDYVDGKFYYSNLDEECTLLDEELFNSYIEHEMVFEKDITIYNDSLCSNKVVENGNTQYEENKYYAKTYNSSGEESKLLSGEEIPNSAKLDRSGSKFAGLFPRRIYDMQLKLTNKTTPSTTPIAGDELGTITITIRAA